MWLFKTNGTVSYANIFLLEKKKKKKCEILAFAPAKASLIFKKKKKIPVYLVIKS